MPTYAWVIDQTTCIGCHACSTACKSENDVPLGVNRTWVKYIERGSFPTTRRDIAVLRCNHCAEPPCVEICPTSAMIQRPDGIVDFEPDRCIGCKACIQACPYDAIYIDPEAHVAEKCDFCSHRVDNGLLPACVVVCPTESLVFGDMDDPSSRVSRVLATTETTVRRAEQGTRPKAFYVGASADVLDPLAPVHPDRYAWGDRRVGGAKDHTPLIATAGAAPGAVLPVSRVGAPLPVLALNAVRGPGIGPVAGSEVPRDAVPAANAGPSTAVAPAVPRPAAVATFDVFHPTPWGAKVAGYLWTKGIAAGAFPIAFLAGLLGLGVSDPIRLGAAVVVGLTLAATAVLLVWDLKRPERFWTILVRTQRRSWLAIGAWVILGYGVLVGAWFLATLGGARAVADAAGLVALPFGVMTALYSAFLLGQCEARDLWQRPVLGLVLLAQAAVLGAGGVLVAGLLLDRAGLEALLPALAAVLGIGGAAHAGALLAGEAGAGHPTANGVAAAHLLVRGPFRTAFWVGGVLLAGVMPLVVAVLAPAVEPLLLASLAGAVGVLWYEHGFLAAGQAVPIS